MKQILYLLQFILLFTCSVFGQQPFNFVSSPSPSAQNGNLSSNVNPFTGKLGLSIPFYQYKSPSSNLAFSVSLDYSSGGLKLTENPTCVGAGWNLNAGGSIHRIINGAPDDIQRFSKGGFDRSGFSYAPIVDNVPCPLNYRAPGYYDNPDNKIQQDSEADEFQFNFLGKQGSFVIPKKGLFDPGPQPITKPQSNLKFYFISGNSASNITTGITQIIITDDNGVEYSFTGLETTRRKKSRTVYDSSTTFQSGIGSRGVYHYEYDFIDEYYITGWNLTKIKDTNNGEEINLEYEDYIDNTKSQSTVTEYKRNSQTLGDWYWDNRNFEQGTRQRLKSVSFKNNDILRLVYDKISRCDYLSDKALVNINIENSNGNMLTYGLNFVYYKGASEIPYGNCYSLSEDESRAKWLFLKSITKNIPTVSTKIAEFEYIRSSDKVDASSPDNIIPTRREAKNQDAWGFYNGDEVTEYTRLYNTPFNIIKSPSQYATQIGSLKKVIYPSGGTTAFEYEGNSILGSAGTDVPSYGIRVKKVTQFDGINAAKNIVKEYRYLNESGTSSGFAMTLPPSTYTNKMKVYASGVTESYVITSSTTVLPPVSIQGSPVAYARIEEVSSLGKTINEYRSFSDQQPLVTTYTYPFANKDRIADWNYGLLMKQTVKDINDNTVKYTQNNYNVINNTVSGVEFHQIKSAYQAEFDQPVFIQSNDPTSCSQASTTYQFVYDPYNPVTGRSELTETNEKQYLKDGSIVSNKVQYEYDPNQYSLKKVTTYNSTNEKLEKILFYPYEYSASSSTYKLAAKNIKSLPVSSLSVLTKGNGSKFITGFEKSEFQGDNSVRPLRSLTMKSNKPIPISSTKTLFTPEEDYGEATSKLTADVTYNKFDTEGKTLQTASKEASSSAIWDIDSKVIVAKANASFDNIAYTSFETNEKGNWSYSGKIFFDITAPAGKKCFNLSGNTITKSLLTSNITYIVSYWSNGGSCNVGGTFPYVTGRTINGWTYYKHRISGIESLNIIGNVFIDELRIHPENARMTTVTYEPLIGITSESGTEDEITKYEYDSFGRLLDIKNQFGNILKIFCYNSAGTPSACGDAPIFKNTAVPKTLYKSCGPGYSTNAISYTVPAGRYVSFISQEDANGQADKDILTFGQSYADKIGVCTQTTTIYARLGYENVTYSGSSTYGDVVVRFFSDASCTVPINISNIPVSYYCNNSANSTNPSGTGSVTASGSVTILQKNALLQWQVYECDAGTGPCFTNTYSNDYYLNQSPNYQITY